MARIPEEEVERLKREVSLERLVSGSGVELRPHGKDRVGRCPFHSPDEHPSFVVTPDRNLFHCFSCGAAGSVIDWVMKTEKVSFRRAVEILRDLAGYAPLPVAKGPEAALPLDAGDEELKRLVVGFYAETLKQSSEALAYLEKRGLKSSEAVDTFKLGYANRTLAYRLPEKSRQAGAQIRGRLQALGVLRESGHEHFSGSLVVPVLDENGRVVQMYGRKVRDDLRKGTPSHLYLPGPLRGVWNVQALHAGSGVGGTGNGGEEIILCEALIDALTFWVHGFRHVTAAYGVNGFTEDHWAAIRKHDVARVFIAYDRDEAGDRAAEELSEQLLAEGVECFRVQFPKGMDANEYALKVTPAARSLALLLRSAAWLGKGKKTGAVARDSWPAVRDPGSVGRDSWSEADGIPVSGSAGFLVESLPETAASFLAASSEPLPAEAAKKETTVVPGPAPDSLTAAVAASPPAPGPGPAPSEDAVAATSPLTPEPVPDPFPVAPSPAAPPLPAGPGLDIPAQVSGDEVVIHLADRRWRVRGLSKNLSYELLKVNVLVSRSSSFLHEPPTTNPEPSSFHVDTFDLYQARHRATFVKQASLELGLKEDVVKADLGRVLLKLEELQDAQIRKALEPKVNVVELTTEEKAEAMELLRSPDLLERILADFETCGVVGEETNKLTGYLAAVSRKLERPLAVMVQSSSAAGKSALMEAILAFVPEEERVKYSAMTGQSLFYMSETDLRHKVLAIAEEEGAERAAYALKLLQSEGELSIASTGKDPSTGRLVTHEYRVEGPVMIFLTTTSIEIDEELQNRCVVLTVNEGREQTKAIHRKQREMETLEGLLEMREAERLKKLHRNAQRLLRPVLVSNPFARSLTFLDDTTRTRRDHKKYLSLIRSIACLKQHQRPVKTTSGRGRPEPYVEVTLEDIALANRLADEVLGRSLDELPPQTRRFLELLEAFAARRCEALGARRDELRFSRREVREATGWTYFQVRVHLDRLVELEYVLAHRGGRGRSFEYELLYDGKGKDGKAFLVGLIDVEALGKQAGHAVTTETSRGPQAGLRGLGEAFEGPLSPRSAPVEPGLRGGGNGSKAASHQDSGDIFPENPRKTPIPGNGKRPPSNRYAGRTLEAFGATKNEAASRLAAPAAEKKGVMS